MVRQQVDPGRPYLLVKIPSSIPLVDGYNKDVAATEVRDPAIGSVSPAGYAKVQVGITGAELSGGVAKTDQADLSGADGRLKFQAHGTEGSLPLDLFLAVMSVDDYDVSLPPSFDPAGCKVGDRPLGVNSRILNW